MFLNSRQSQARADKSSHQARAPLPEVKGGTLPKTILREIPVGKQSAGKLVFYILVLKKSEDLKNFLATMQ